MGEALGGLAADAEGAAGGGGGRGLLVVVGPAGLEGGEEVGGGAAELERLHHLGVAADVLLPPALVVRKGFGSHWRERGGRSCLRDGDGDGDGLVGHSDRLWAEEERCKILQRR